MFTLLKVRDQITSHEDPGWYPQPPNTTAQAASLVDIARDGIVVPS
jgi:hypothetical protein